MKLIVFTGLLIQLATIGLYYKTKEKDNLTIATVPAKTNNFTGTKWFMQEIRFLQENTPYYYRRDGGNYNINFDNDYIIFNCDGTGIYHQSDGVEFELKWQANDKLQKTIVYTIKNFRHNTDLVVTWEDIETLDTEIRYTEYYTHQNGIESLGVATRTNKYETVESFF